MKNKRQKTLLIIALVLVFLCGCPGCFLSFQGFRYFSAAIGTIQTFEDFLSGIAAGFLNGGWWVCISGFMILIPFVFVILAVFQRKNGDEDLEELAPTGASEDDPIPPPS